MVLSQRADQCVAMLAAHLSALVAVPVQMPSLRCRPGTGGGGCHL